MALPFLSLSNLVKNKFVIKFAITLRAGIRKFRWHFFHCFYRTFRSIAVTAHSAARFGINLRQTQW